MTEHSATPFSGLDYHPLTPDRWRDLERLFGEKGAFGGCWCMWWRTTRAQFARQSGQGNRDALKSIADSGQAPGILAYRDGQPVGWCSVAPRETYPSLNRSRTLKPVDSQPVWSIVCFFIFRPFRGLGVATGLLQAAIDHAAAHGATIVEAYPTDTSMYNAFSGYMGATSTFQKAGFVEVARRSARQPIMRYLIQR